MDNFRYTVALLRAIEDGLNSNEGDLTWIEYKVDYYNARKAVGHNLRLMRDWLNKEGLYENG